MAIIRNYTPHTVTVLNEDGAVLAAFPSDGVARAAQTDIPAGMLGGIPIVRSTFGAPVGLPEPAPDTYLIVSMATASAARAHGRTTEDLLLTSAPVRDGEGRIIGCRQLALA